MPPMWGWQRRPGTAVSPMRAPCIALSGLQRRSLEVASQKVLDARASVGGSLVDIYDPDMTPEPLVRAHRGLVNGQFTLPTGGQVKRPTPGVSWGTTSFLPRAWRRDEPRGEPVGEPRG